jgi:Uma2 family endonuclease
MVTIKTTLEGNAAMSEAARQWVSPEEYLALEDQAETKSEYFAGEIYAMSGGTSEHNLLAGNVARELGNLLFDRPCLVYPSEQRVKVQETGLYTYPDVVVVWGPPEFEDDRRTELLNPTVIIEVLSDSTEAYDRGEKFAQYQALPSLREYVLVASNRYRMERFSRSEGSSDWLLSVCREPGRALTLDSIGCTLELDRVYHKVELQERPSGRRRGALRE